MGLRTEIWTWSLGEGGYGGGEEKKKFPICVKEQVINPFGAATLLSPSTTIKTYFRD